MRGRAYFFISLIILFGATTAPAATRTWIGGAGNNLSTPANWVEGIAPETGDDLVFPATALFRTPKCDLSAGTTLRSMTFDGGAYTFSDGSCHTRSLSSVGDLVLGPFPWSAPWTVDERLVLNGGTLYAVISLGGPQLDATVGDAAIARVNLTSGHPGSSVIKDGAGDLLISLVGAHLSSATAEEGTMSVTGGVVDVVNVAGGYILTGEVSGASIRATGQSSVIWARNHSTNSLEITDGAQFRILSCPNAFTTVQPPILTGGTLIPATSSNCPGTRDRFLILNTSNEPVVGEFDGFPEGHVITSGARRYRLTYKGGDGNDVQILAIPGVPYDFDADGRSDISTFRPSDGTWYLQDAAGTPARRWGQENDRLTPGDYDGDGRTDHAVYRPSEGAWYIRYSYDVYWYPQKFGMADDLPVPADYDGDGRTDIAIFRPSIGTWWLKSSLNSAPGYGVSTVQFGRAGDTPVPADYDGDGRADVAVFRPENATWYIRRSSGGDLIIQWGTSTDKAVPADYDGEGKADIAVFRPSEGNWYRFLSTTQSPDIVNWGIATDQPVPADYDGDGKTDVAIFRPSDGNWWLNQTTAGVTVHQFGTSDDRPVPGAFIY